MSSNIHGISCTANNYLKEAWSNIKNEHEKNQKYSITLFENTLVCFIQLYKEIRRQQAEDYIPCLECDSLEKEFEEIQNDNDLSLFMKTLRTNDKQIYSGVSGGITSGGSDGEQNDETNTTDANSSASQNPTAPPDGMNMPPTACVV